MGKKAKKKDSNGHLRPPLTFIDKCIYFLCFAVAFVGTLLLEFCFLHIKDMIAFSNADAVAYRSHADFIFALPFLLFLETGALVVLLVGFESKKPIFGSKKYRYGEYPYKEDCIPLFYKNRYNRKKTPSQKKFMHKMTALWCAGFLLCACLFPFGLFGRNVLCRDNHIEKINTVNLTGDIYTSADFANLTVRTRYVSGYRIADYWKYEIIIQMKDGKNFSFSNRDFDWRSAGANDVCLDKMLEIKSLFAPETITINGADNTDDVAEFLGFNEAQRTKLDELFSS